MLTADEVLNAKFQPTKFRDGYDQDEVDDFLDRVVETLRARQDGRAGTLTSADVAAQRFSPTKFREGYDPEDVDRLLDQVRATLDGVADAPPRPSAAAGGPASTGAAPTLDPSSTPGLVPPAKGWRRLFGG